MTIISPSILSCDFLNIESEIKAFNDLKNIWFHLDIMDSHFVPNLTFGHPIIKNIHKITNHPLDAHFMVTNPEFFIETCKNFKIHNFTFHIEATNNPLALTTLAKQYYSSVGVSIKPKTPTNTLSHELLKKIDLLLVMSVEPGFGGQSFIENSYNKIKEFDTLRKSNSYKYKIQVDGGVSSTNAQKLINCGVDNLVAGSYIFKAKNKQYKTMIDSIR